MAEHIKLPVGEHHEVWVAASNKEDRNMGLRFGERREVLANRTRLYGRIGLKPGKVGWIKTKGGDKVIDFDHPDISAADRGRGVECDAGITATVDRGLAFFPADCVPLVVYGSESPAASLIHCGRPSVELGIHTRAIDRLMESHCLEIEDLRIFMGPSITKESYRYEYLDPALEENECWEGFIKFSDDDGMYHLDLIGLVNRDLSRLGIEQHQITQPTIDTGADPDYFSHRRSQLTGEANGRNGVVVALRKLEKIT